MKIFMKPSWLLILLLVSTFSIAQNPFPLKSIKDIQWVHPDSLRKADSLQAVGVAFNSATFPHWIEDSRYWHVPPISSTQYGDTFTVVGIVMNKPQIYLLGNRYAVFIQDTAGGPWSGIIVLANDTTSSNTQATGIQVLDTGMVVKIVGRVEEFPANSSTGYTELFTVIPDPQTGQIIPIEILDWKLQRPEPVEVRISDFVTGNASVGGHKINFSNGEKWEDVYVVIKNVSVVNRSGTVGGRWTWWVGDDSGNVIQVYDGSRYFRGGSGAFDPNWTPPPIGTKLEYIRGVIVGVTSGYAITPLYPGDIKISGHDVPWISYRFNSIDFGSVYVGRDLDKGLMIYNVGSDTLRITGISVRDSVRFRYVGNLPLNVDMGDSVELRFRPDGSGSWVDSVLIRNNSVNDSLFKLVLRGRGVRPPYLSSVDSVNFGLVIFGDSLSKSIWVKNTGEIDTVRISKVEVDAPFYVRGVSKSVLPPGDSSRIDLVLKGEVDGYRSSALKVISNAWNDTLKISLYGAVTPFKQFTSFRQVQSGVVKFVYQVQTTSTFDLKKFEYSTDGVNWVESKNISGSTTITGTKTDTIYWDSKKDLPNFESLNVKVRFTFTGGGFDFPVVLNVGVDNKPPSFTGIKGHSFLGFNSVKLLFNRGVDISKFDYIVSFVDTVDRVYRFYKTSLDSVVLGGFYSVAGYVFYVRCVDEFGNVGDSLRYDVKFPAVGDYNFDEKIDAYDLGVFVLGWTNRDSVCDFYPFEGRVPVVRVVGDKKLDAGDVWVFTMFWDRGKRGGFGKVSELSVESLGNERGMNLRYSGGYVTIGFDDFDVSGRFISGGVEIVYDRGSFRFDSLLFDFDGLKLSYVDSSGGVFYLDFGRGGGFDFEKLGARVRFRVLREVNEGMIVKLKLYDENLKLFERSYRISFEEVPTEYALYQNYPNPFNPTTTIEFDIPEKANVKLIVYDILGREVETIVDKELEPGKYKLNFNATNLPTGVYFYTLRTPKFTKTNKMLLIK